MIISIAVDHKSFASFKIADISESQMNKLLAQLERDLMHYAIGLGKAFTPVLDNEAAQ